MNKNANEENYEKEKKSEKQKRRNANILNTMKQKYVIRRSVSTPENNKQDEQYKWAMRG